jgi:ferritin-like metal-binding protein YciE
MSKVFQELSQAVQDPDIKEALEARVFVTQKMLDTVDHCFELIGEQPVKLTGRLNEVFVEDARRELGEIQNQAARNLFILAKASQVVHLRIAELKALVAAADLSGHYAVGVLLESCLADSLAFVERTRRIIRNMFETKLTEKIATRIAA